ncbi:MAG: hypothetical protein HUK04_03170, partial [Bacteroidaceae bacterium]|nr:hypothetical protein [Bacteroidaceae bacterium]
MRCRIIEMTDVSALVMTDDGGEATIQLSGTPFASLLRNARVGETLAVVESHRARGVVFPTLAVLEPDLLIDVTTLCGCMKPYGFHALNSLLGRYESRVTTWQIELGNMANDFFDACVHDNRGSEKTLHKRFMEAVTRSFRANALRYSAVEGIDAGFFHDAEQQFGNIYRTVHDTLPRIGVKLSDVILEPQFLSPELGLQGRLDALCHDTIIELKSGKADEFHGGKPKEEHELQMILYSEMLGRKALAGAARKRNLLFYSRYPKLLAVSHTLYQLQTAIAVRNDIVALERDTREGRLADIMDTLREEDFNTSREDGKLYNNYMRPVIVRFLERMRSLPPLERAYFHTFAQFIAREQHICKTQFANVWLTPLAAQESEGEAVTGLTLHPVADMDGSIVELRAETAHDLTSTNFRRGDAVMLFESTEGVADFGTSREMGGGPGVGMGQEVGGGSGFGMGQEVCGGSGFGTGQEVGGGSGVGTIHSQIFRCQVTGISQHSIHLALAYKQRSESVFRPGREYAIAPSYMEATFSQSYKGLTALITSNDDRRSLLLGMRQP